MPNMDIKSGVKANLRQVGSDLFVDSLSTFSLDFGNNSISATDADRWLAPFGSPSWATATTAINEYVTDTDFEANSMTVYHGQPKGNGEPIVYTLQKNGVDTALSVSIPSTQLVASSALLENPILFNRGDSYSVKVTKALNVQTSPNRICATISARSL